MKTVLKDFLVIEEEKLACEVPKMDDGPFFE